MSVISDDSGTYSVGPDGKKRYAAATECKLNDEFLYRFSAETGILEISANERSIELLVESIGGLPKDELILPAYPLGEPLHFHNVKEIKSFPRKDGSFFIKIAQPEEKAETNSRELALYSGNKLKCDNCSRQFKSGEIVSVDKLRKLIFCYSDAGGGCSPAYTFSTGVITACEPMKFGDAKLSPAEQTPNYPNSPIIDQKTTANPAQQKWYKKIFGKLHL